MLMPKDVYKRQGQCRLEGDNAVDVGHGGSSDVGVAVPRTGTLPREIVGDVYKRQPTTHVPRNGLTMFTHPLRNLPL